MVNEKLAREICGLVLAINALLETPNNIGPAEAESLRMKSDSAQKALEEEYATEAAEKAEAPITHGLHLDSGPYVPEPGMRISSPTNPDIGIQLPTATDLHVGREDFPGQKWSDLYVDELYVLADTGEDSMGYIYAKRLGMERGENGEFLLILDSGGRISDAPVAVSVSHDRVLTPQQLCDAANALKTEVDFLKNTFEICKVCGGKSAGDVDSDARCSSCDGTGSDLIHGMSKALDNLRSDLAGERGAQKQIIRLVGYVRAEVDDFCKTENVVTCVIRALKEKTEHIAMLESRSCEGVKTSLEVTGAPVPNGTIDVTQSSAHGTTIATAFTYYVPDSKTDFVMENEFDGACSVRVEQVDGKRAVSVKVSEKQGSIAFYHNGVRVDQ